MYFAVCVSLIVQKLCSHHVLPRQIVTGSYHNLFRIFDRPSGHDITLEASRDNISGPTHRLNPVTILQGAV